MFDFCDIRWLLLFTLLIQHVRPELERDEQYELIEPVLSVYEDNNGIASNTITRYLFTFKTKQYPLYAIVELQNPNDFNEHNRLVKCHFYHGTVFAPKSGYIALTICKDEFDKLIIYSTIMLQDGGVSVIRDINYLPNVSIDNTDHRGLMVQDNFDYITSEDDEEYKADSDYFRFDPHLHIQTRSNQFESECTEKYIPTQRLYRRIRDTTKAAKKRTSNKVYDIETIIFVDKALTRKYSHNMKELEKFIYALMNEVQLIYNFDTMKTRIRILIKKIEYLVENQKAPNTGGGDIDQYLDNFCLWQKRLLRMANKSSRWDHALMLTGLDLYKKTGNKKNFKVLGLAWVNGMCKDAYSCTINEAKNFESAFVIAHELGHSLGILHDGVENSCDKEANIMSEKTGRGKINWSLCSNKYLENFLKNSNTKCLEKLSGDVDQYYNSPFEFKEDMTLPGEQYSLNRQCQLALGREFRVYSTGVPPFDELWCSSASWATPAHPALEGSNCGEGKSCYQGACRSIDELNSSKKILTYFNRHRKPAKGAISDKSTIGDPPKNTANSTGSTFMRRVQSFLRSTINSIGKLFSG